MKAFLVVVSLFLMTSPLRGQEEAPVQIPDPVEKKFSEEELLETWGWLLAERFNLKSFDFNAREMERIFEGMGSHVRGEPAPVEVRESMMQMQQYFTEREERMLQKTLRENRAKEQAFFDDLFGLPGVQSLGSGLYYQILEPGNEKKPKRTDSVIVHYEGRFLDNTVFDSTSGRQPAAFKLDEVIDGWTQGVPLIGEGGKIKLFVPAKLGYGDQARPSIPPGSTLVFEIELLKVGLPEGAAEGANGGPGPDQEADAPAPSPSPAEAPEPAE